MTDGQPAVTRVLSVNDRYTSDQVLEMAASVERHSQHPLALAVMKRAAEQEVVFAGQDDQFEILPGRGVRSWTDESEILVGNERLLEEYSVPIADATATHYREYAGNAETAMYVTFQRELAGIITVSAPIRSEARESIAQLRKAGINRLVMLTGDAEPVAQRSRHGCRNSAMALKAAAAGQI